MQYLWADYFQGCSITFPSMGYFRSIQSVLPYTLCVVESIQEHEHYGSPPFYILFFLSRYYCVSPLTIAVAVGSVNLSLRFSYCGFDCYLFKIFYFFLISWQLFYFSILISIYCIFQGFLLSSLSPSNLLYIFLRLSVPVSHLQFSPSCLPQLQSLSVNMVLSTVIVLIVAGLHPCQLRKNNG